MAPQPYFLYALFACAAAGHPQQHHLHQSVMIAAARHSHKMDTVCQQLVDCDVTEMDGGVLSPVTKHTAACFVSINC